MIRDLFDIYKMRESGERKFQPTSMEQYALKLLCAAALSPVLTASVTVRRAVRTRLFSPALAIRFQLG